MRDNAWNIPKKLFLAFETPEKHNFQSYRFEIWYTYLSRRPFLKHLKILENMLKTKFWLQNIQFHFFLNLKNPRR